MLSSLSGITNLEKALLNSPKGFNMYISWFQKALLSLKKCYFVYNISSRYFNLLQYYHLITIWLLDWSNFNITWQMNQSSAKIASKQPWMFWRCLCFIYIFLSKKIQAQQVYEDSSKAINKKYIKSKNIQLSNWIRNRCKLAKTQISKVMLDYNFQTLIKTWPF